MVFGTHSWQWKVASAALVIAPFLAVDLIFLLANLLKVFEGGWLPLAVGASLMLLMLTWRQGTRILSEVSKKDEVSLADFITMIAKSSITRASGTAVFLTGNPDATPTALLHNIKHNKVLHENNIVLKVITEDMPRVADDERIVGCVYHRLALRAGEGRDLACRATAELKLFAQRNDPLFNLLPIAPTTQRRMIVKKIGSLKILTANHLSFFSAETNR